MSVRTLIAALAVFAGSVAVGQEPPAAGPAKKPIDVFRSARDQIADGRYELAAELLKDFQALAPSDQDYLDIEARFGPTAFAQLRNVPRWFPDRNREAEFRKSTLDVILKGSVDANAKLSKDPKRIAGFVRNLGGFPEERAFAVDELRRSGDAAVQPLVDSLRLDVNADQRNGVYTALSGLGADIVPGVLAAAEGLTDDLKLGVLRALMKRPDVLSLTQRTDTNFLPLLWYMAGTPGSPSSVRDSALEMLVAVAGPGVEKSRPEVELVKAAESLYARKGVFQATVAADAATGDKSNAKAVKVWAWDAAKQNVFPTTLPPTEAEERFGLKYLRWANERNPGYEPAVGLFVSLATERAVERAKYTSLARSEPGVYRLLTAAPSSLLIERLEQALGEKRTAVAYGLISVLGDRVERTAAVAEPREGGPPRPPVLAKALEYPDPRVQLAAAVALLRMPPPTAHGANSRVVEVLARAAAGDGGDKTARGKALVADPAATRADEVAGLLRQIGYQTELVGSGRELLRRVGRAADFDLIVVDRQVADPELGDVLGQLQRTANGGGRPVLVVASSSTPRVPNLETLLARLAALIAATETVDTPVPLVNQLDRRKPPEEAAADRARSIADREKALRAIYDERIGRFERLTRAADFITNPQLRARVNLRIPQLTLAAVLAEYDATPDTAPALFRDLAQATDLVRRQTELDASVKFVATEKLTRLIGQLESVLTPDLRKRFDSIRGRMDAETLGLPAAAGVDAEADAAARKVARRFPGVAVIAEPFERESLEQDVKGAVADPAQMPRSPDEKRASAKLAVDWLRRIAVGEVQGYDVRPAEAALRQAVTSDDTAEPAIDALIRIPSAAAQSELVRTAGVVTRPLPIRQKAADAAVRHVQSHGKLADGQLLAPLANETDPDLRARYLVLASLLAATPKDLTDRIKGYSPPTVTTPPPAKEPPKDAGAAPPPPKDENK